MSIRVRSCIAYILLNANKQTTTKICLLFYVSSSSRLQFEELDERLIIQQHPG